MNEIKNIISKEFTILPNAIFSDIKLDAMAIRIFGYMASRPDNWQFYNNDISNVCKVKSWRTLSKYMKQLITTGWVTRTRKKGKAGKFAGYYYTLNANPASVTFLQTGKMSHFNNKEVNILASFHLDYRYYIGVSNENIKADLSDYSNYINVLSILNVETLIKSITHYKTNSDKRYRLKWSNFLKTPEAYYFEVKEPNEENNLKKFLT